MAKAKADGRRQMPELPASAISHDSFPISIVLSGSRIQLPPVLVALDDFVARLQLLVVLVFHAERLADVVDDVLVGGRIVAAWRFLTGEIRVLDVDVGIAGGESVIPWCS